MIGAVIGDYELLGLLGAGGMGSVYRARHRTLGLERALKLVAQEGAPERLERFAREGANLARIHHEGVVRVHEAGLDRGRAYLVMDLVEGVPLDRLLADGRVPMQRALALAVRLARGVTALHAAGVVHRDLKPQNVIVGDDGRPVIIDLGLAVAPERDARLTRSGAFVGTPTHMAPEQLLGRPAGPPADVFALGLIVFELTTGAPAVPPLDTLMGLIDEVTSRPRPRARSVAPSTPAWLDALLARALEREPSRRPSASEFAVALRSRSAPDDARRRFGPRVVLSCLAAAALAALAALALDATRPAATPSAKTTTASTPVAEAPLASPDPEAARQLRRIEREPDLAQRLAALSEWLARWAADPAAEHARALERQVRVLLPVELGAAAGTRSARFLDDGRVVTAGEAGLELWDAARGGTLGRLIELPCRGPLVVLADGRILASDESHLRLVDPGPGGRAPAELELEAAVQSLAAAADGRTALAGLASGVAVRIDLAAWRVTARLAGHEHPVYAVALSADGALALTGTGEGPKVGQDDAVRLWEASGRLLRREALEDRVGAVSFLPGAREFLAGTAAGRLFRFSVERAGSTAMFVVAGDPAGTPLLKPQAHPGPIRGLVVSADGRRAWSVSGGPPDFRDVLVAWDVVEVCARLRVEAAGRGLDGVDLSPDGRRLVTGGRVGRPAVWATD